MKNVVKVEELTKGSCDYNAVEECWRQGEEDLPVLCVVLRKIVSELMLSSIVLRHRKGEVTKVE